MHILLLNGPPSSGKDTVARMLLDLFNERRVDAILLRMSHPIKRAFAGMVDSGIDPFGNVTDWEVIKDQPHVLLDDTSYRQWQINFSERFMKPLYGDDIFGRLFVHTLNYLRPGGVSSDPWNGFVLVPDCGFSVEATTIRRLMPEATMSLIHIKRPGADFSRDSRSYITVPDGLGPEPITLLNDDSLHKLKANVVKLATDLKWIGQSATASS